MRGVLHKSPHFFMFSKAGAAIVPIVQTRTPGRLKRERSISRSNECKQQRADSARPSLTPVPCPILSFLKTSNWFPPRLTCLFYTPTQPCCTLPFLTGDWQVNGTILHITAKISFHPKGQKHLFVHVKTSSSSSALQDKVWPHSPVYLASLPLPALGTSCQTHYCESLNTL